MLRELKKEIVNQPEKGVTRRVFIDDDDRYFDLYVWYDQNNNVIGFQLCYACFSKAFTWFKDKGVCHENISRAGYKDWEKNFLLLPDGYFDNHRICERFLESAKNLDKEVTSLVKQILQNPENDISTNKD